MDYTNSIFIDHNTMLPISQMDGNVPVSLNTIPVKDIHSGQSQYDHISGLAEHTNCINCCLLWISGHRLPNSEEYEHIKGLYARVRVTEN